MNHRLRSSNLDMTCLMSNSSSCQVGLESTITMSIFFFCASKWKSKWVELLLNIEHAAHVCDISNGSQFHRLYTLILIPARKDQKMHFFIRFLWYLTNFLDISLLPWRATQMLCVDKCVASWIKTETTLFPFHTITFRLPFYSRYVSILFTDTKHLPWYPLLFGQSSYHHVVSITIVFSKYCISYM